MKLRTFLEYLFLLLPFCSFLLGYYLLSSRHPIREISVPNLTGQQLNQVVRLLSAQQLNIRIIAEKEDADLEDGTIIQQSPTPGQKVKPHQSLHLIISKKPDPTYMPRLIGNQEEFCKKEMLNHALRASWHYVEGSKKSGTCIAQLPAPYEQIGNVTPIVYIARHHETPVIMPNLKGRTIHDIKDFFALYPVVAEYLHKCPSKTHHSCSTCIVVDQRPLPGSIITFIKEKPLHVQLLLDQQ
ncbi:PASTA domain-containing protein [Candidatus Dependentiae bacterium]|nr:PASTA domain-containing protein [Candidatus Dependentiae bacterium]